MYLLPSTSTSVAPDARAMKSGDPPTDLNARTGLSTPPGSRYCARAKSRCDRVVFIETTLSHRSAGAGRTRYDRGRRHRLDKFAELACHAEEKPFSVKHDARVLYEKHGRALLAYACALLRDSSAAEDVL